LVKQSREHPDIKEPPAMRHSSNWIAKLAQSSSNVLMLLGMSLSLFSLPQTASAQEAPSKQFIRKNVPIAWILNRPLQE
jgi:hypothetical protein